MNGKKWVAAEKHFHGKEDELRREWKSVEAERNQLREVNKSLSAQVEIQRNEIDKLNDWVDRLLEYTQLSREDINKACQKDKSIASLGEILKSITEFGGYGF